MEYAAAAFHGTMAHVILETVKKVSKKHKTKNVALSGGVFQNTILLSEATKLLKKEKYNVLLHNKLSPNDSSIAIGQAVYAAKKIGDR